MLQKKMENVDALTSLLKAKTVELENQKQKGDELREELNNRNSRVMELDADKFFLNGDFHEKCIVEEQLMQTITQLRQSCLDEKKRQDREGPRKTRIKVKVLRAFQWDESTADPVLLRAVCEFWYGLSECNRATDGG
jgi:dynactin complex subunit